MRNLTGILMMIVIALVLVALLSGSWLPVIPVVILQVIITATDRNIGIYQRKVLAFFVYLFVEVIAALVIFGIIWLIRLL